MNRMRLTNLVSHRAVLNSDWIAICLQRGHMLGPRWKPEWGGHRVKYCPKVEEFFDDSENIKEVLLCPPRESSTLFVLNC